MAQGLDTASCARLFSARITLVVGHFGSGKTEIALNGAFDLAAEGVPVTLADVDVVKPYFRSRAARELLRDRGVELIAPEGENVHADLPIIVPQLRDAVRHSERRLVMDAGGDDTGARVVGSLADVLPVEETTCLLVLNFRRPFTRNPQEGAEAAREIELASRVKVDAVVSNTHLMDETTPAVVLEGYEMALETGRLLGVPVAAVTVEEPLLAQLDGAVLACPLLRLRRVVMPPFERVPYRPRIGPVFVLN